MKVAEVLTAIGVTPPRVADWAQPIASACNEFGIDTPARFAAFAAQVGHESNLLSAVEENLNYSGDGLLKLFKKYYPTPSAAADHARKPELIANRVYANRMGNGPEESGDGWRYRGRGLIQLTGKDNYKACGAALGLPLEKDPALLVSAVAAARSAGWFWKSRGLNGVTDFTVLTKKINGGTNGLEHRLALHAKAKAALGV